MAESTISSIGKIIVLGRKNSFHTKGKTKSAIAPTKRIAQASQLFTKSKVRRNATHAIPTRARICQKANAENNLIATGKRTAAKIARELGEPMVLKTGVLAKSNGKKNLPNSCKIPNKEAMEPETKIINKSRRTSSFFEKSWCTKKKKIAKDKSERKLSLICSGQPQKLPYLE